jgi:hypothetical protein
MHNLYRKTLDTLRLGKPKKIKLKWSLMKKAMMLIKLAQDHVPRNSLLGD